MTMAPTYEINEHFKFRESVTIPLGVMAAGPKREMTTEASVSVNAEREAEIRLIVSAPPVGSGQKGLTMHGKVNARKAEHGFVVKSEIGTLPWFDSNSEDVQLVGGEEINYFVRLSSYLAEQVLNLTERLNQLYNFSGNGKITDQGLDVAFMRGTMLTIPVVRALFVAILPIKGEQSIASLMASDSGMHFIKMFVEGLSGQDFRMPTNPVNDVLNRKFREAGLLWEDEEACDSIDAIRDELTKA